MIKEHMVQLIKTTLRDFGERAFNDSDRLITTPAMDLELGTHAQETQWGKYYFQLGNGPAIGYFQMEPFTENDIWETYLAFRPKMVEAITAMFGITGPSPMHLTYNLGYQIVMSRLRYYRVPEKLPKLEDFEKEYSYILAIAKYWKKHYNSSIGLGTIEEFMENFKTYVRHF